MNFQTNMIVALVLLAVSAKLFVDHRSGNYVGIWNFAGSYPTISSGKHDVTKVVFTELFPLLVYGLTAGQKFFDPNDFLNSSLGRIFVVASGYFVYHELVQPYVVARMPAW